MKVRVVAVGRVRGPLAGLVGEYEARAARYWKLEVREVVAGGKGGRAPPERVREAEAERLSAELPEGMDMVALTRAGDPMTSAALASYLGGLAVGASPGVTFAIGGAFGLAPAILARAGRLLSLSAMTLPHEMARLVLAEQLYRAGTIVRGEPYHKTP
jgi:23S rRNA (pseudouridine1915-N3)-methyltransferase